MYTFILLAIVTVILIVAGVLLDKYTYMDILPGVLTGTGVVAGLTGIILALTLINIDTRFQAKLNQYEVITEMVDSYDGQDFGNMAALTEQVVSMNNTIAAHLAHCTSPWTGVWFSPDIANQEPIRFDRKTQKLE